MPVLRALLLILLGASAGLGGEVRLLKGSSYPGELVRLTDKELHWQDAKSNLITEPLHAVLSIELQPVPALPASLKYTDVELTDGTLLHCSQVAIKGKRAELSLAGSNHRIEVPLAVILYILSEAQDAVNRQEWQDKFLAKRGKQDVLAIKRQGVVNPLLGTFGDGTEKGNQIDFELASPKRKITLDLTNIHGMIFVRKPNPDAPAALCKVYDTQHNILVVHQVTLDESGFALLTVAGAKLSYPKALIGRLDFGNDKLAYLSDLEPIKSKNLWKLQSIDDYGRDKTLDKSPLRLAGQVFAKGLELHASTELVYDLDGKYKEFKSILGVDDAVTTPSHVLVRVEGDGRDLFSGEVHRKDKPQLLAVDVRGVKQLRLIVGCEGILPYGHRVDFADAKVSK